jgi:hypothetical protein
MNDKVTDKKYFLARSGETFGPYDQRELGRLRESGAYRGYTWFWDPAHPGWQAIDPAPAAPRIAPESAPPPAATATATAAHPAVPLRSFPGISALCLGPHAIQAGTLQKVTDGGCEFVSDTEGSAAAFAIQCLVRLNLADPTGRSMNVQARVGSVYRRNGRWHLRLNWQGCPAILEENRGPEPLRSTVSNPVA